MINQIEVINLRLYGSGGRGDVFLGNLRSDRTPVIAKFARDAHLPNVRRVFSAKSIS